MQQFWSGTCKDIDHTLYVNAEKFLAQLERHYGDPVREKYDISASIGEDNKVADFYSVIPGCTATNSRYSVDFFTIHEAEQGLIFWWVSCHYCYPFVFKRFTVIVLL